MPFRFEDFSRLSQAWVSPRDAHRGWHLALLLGGLALYFYMQTGLVYSVAMKRTLPIEPDDGYSYIVKAWQMEECFTQRCPAMEDLRQQNSAPSPDDKINWLRYQAYFRLHYIYHPLHSILVSGFHRAGASWERAFALTSCLGSVLIGLGFAAILSALWGAGVAGVGMILLAFSSFLGHGLHYVVPTNMALGLAFLGWAGILLARRPLGFLLAVVLLAPFMHPIGRLYACAAILLFLLKDPLGQWRAKLRPLALALAALFGPWILLRLISYPLLHIQGYPSYAGFSFVAGLKQNITLAVEVITTWLRAYSSGVGFALFGLVALVSVNAWQRRALAAFALSVLWLLPLSIAYVLPHFPGDLFNRVWIATAPLWIGAMAQTIWVLAFGCLRSVRSGCTDRTAWASGLVCAILLTATALDLGGFVKRNLSPAINGFRYMRFLLSGGDSRYPYSEAQVKYLLDHTEPGDFILYADTDLVHNYLLRGLHQRRAIYAVSVLGTELQPVWYDQNPRLKFAVGRVPKELQAIWVKTGVELALSLPSVGNPKKAALQFFNSALQPTRVQLACGATSAEVEVPAQSDAFVDLPASVASCRSALEIRSPSATIALVGFRVSPEQKFHWPWLSTLQLERREAGQTFTYEFGMPKIAHAAMDASWKVIGEDGQSILFARTAR